MSKMRRISASVFRRSVESGSCHAIACRVGASRLPSRIADHFMPVTGSHEKRGAKAALSAPPQLYGGERRISRGSNSPASSAFWKRPACDFSAFARVSNHSAISSNPSSRAVRAIPGYMSVYSCVSPAIAARRLSLGCADRLAGRRIADLLEVFEMAVGVAGLAFGSRAEHRGHVVVPFDIGFLSEIKITAVCLALAGKRFLQVFFGPGTLQRHFTSPQHRSWRSGRSRNPRTRPSWLS